MAEKIVLIDGHSILSRAFYGIPELTNASGLHTNAVYGFLNILFKILEEERPQYLAVAFDRKEPTFRHKMFAEYKGTRKPMPQELHEQVPVMKELLQSMKITIMEKAGYEADDILGTMAKRAQNIGMEVSLISGDRDLLQIADTHIKIRIPKTKSGKTEIEDYYPEDVQNRYFVTPKQFIELKALMGDTSDNIPGVPKIGEKTATSLIMKYGSLDSIYKNIDEITKAAVKQSLKENRELADLSLKLATIDIDADISYDPKSTVILNMFNESSYEMMKQLEFKNFYSRFQLSKVQEKKNLSISKPVLIMAKETLITRLNEFEQFSEVGVFFIEEKNDETLNESENGQIVMNLSQEMSPKQTYFLAIATKEKQYVITQKSKELLSDLLKVVMDVISIRKLKLYCFNFKRFLHIAEVTCNKEASVIVNNYFDNEIAAYLINPAKSEYLLEDLANASLGIELHSYNEMYPKQSLSKTAKTNENDMIQMTGDFAYVNLLLGQSLEKDLFSTGMDSLFYNIEMPLTVVLYEMECAGVLVDRDALVKYGNELNIRIVALEQEIYQEAGQKFNINSPKQLAELLFDIMKIPGGKKTKTGYSTSADVLEKLAQEYPFVEKILEYRVLTKLKSTYADGLYSCIHEDGRIHTSYNQTITATGRLSSTDPNLQNIPMRTELGRQLRKVFVAKAHSVFIDADYSQIELRLLAHMSDDNQLIEAYHSCEDIHKITASKVFHVALDEVTPELRRNAKAVNFGIVYGISSFGLGRDLDISKKEAAEYIEEYFETYPSVKKYLDGCVLQAKEKGFCTTMFGRRRPIPELKSSNFNIRSFGERIAMNAPIQGTAADIMKIAMIQVRDTLLPIRDKAVMLLQVHDELVVECDEDVKNEISSKLISCMEHCVSLNVNLETDCHNGKTWYDAK